MRRSPLATGDRQWMGCVDANELRDNMNMGELGRAKTVAPVYGINNSRYAIPFQHAVQPNFAFAPPVHNKTPVNGSK